MSQQRSSLISDSWKGSSSERLFERANIVSPGGVHSPVRSFRSVGGTPVFFVSANGATLTDVSGKEYVDFCLSFGPLILGHRDPEVEEVVRETAGLAWSFGAAEPYSLELAEFITNRIPWAEKVRFVNSGTEAVMSALRVARAATGREKFSSSTDVITVIWMRFWSKRVPVLRENLPARGFPRPRSQILSYYLWTMKRRFRNYSKPKEKTSPL